VTDPVVVFQCLGAASDKLASSIKAAAREAGLGVDTVGLRSGGHRRDELSVFIYEQPSSPDMEQGGPQGEASRGSQQQQPQQQQQQFITDAWEIIVAGSVPIAAFVVFAKNCLDIFSKTKGILHPPESIHATLDGRKIEVRSGDELRDVLRRYDQTT
jgi:hypothetical protein